MEKAMDNINCPKCGTRSWDTSMTRMPKDGTSPKVTATCPQCRHKWDFYADDSDLEDMKIQVIRKPSAEPPLGCDRGTMINQNLPRILGIGMRIDSDLPPGTLEVWQDGKRIGRIENIGQG